MRYHNKRSFWARVANGVNEAKVSPGRRQFEENRASYDGCDVLSVTKHPFPLPLFLNFKLATKYLAHCPSTWSALNRETEIKNIGVLS